MLRRIIAVLKEKIPNHKDDVLFLNAIEDLELMYDCAQQALTDAILEKNIEYKQRHIVDAFIDVYGEEEYKEIKAEFVGRKINGYSDEVYDWNEGTRG